MNLTVALALALSLLGCQRNQATSEQAAAPAAGKTVAGATAVADPAPTVPFAPIAAGDWRSTPLGRDLERICNVLSYTGTEDRSSNDQLEAILGWLPNNIESEAGTDFLASIAELQGNDKADALDAGAHKVGLSECALAKVWRR